MESRQCLLQHAQPPDRHTSNEAASSGVLAGAKSDLLVVTTIERLQHTSFLDAIVTTNIMVRVQTSHNTLLWKINALKFPEVCACASKSKIDLFCHLSHDSGGAF
jgi:hypothetical protein